MSVNWKLISPENFEKLIRDLLDQIGLQDVCHLGRSGDENIDVLAKEVFKSKRGHIITKSVMVQVKRYLSGKLAPKEYHEILNDAKNHNIDHLIVISLVGYTSGVKYRYLTYKRSNQYPTIELWDKDQIESYIFQFPH